jgi:hypothetical protein
MNDELKGNGHSLLSQHLLGGSEENHEKKFNRDRRCLGRDSNSAPPNTSHESYRYANPFSICNTLFNGRQKCVNFLSSFRLLDGRILDLQFLLRTHLRPCCVIAWNSIPLSSLSHTSAWPYVVPMSPFYMIHEDRYKYTLTYLRVSLWPTEVSQGLVGYNNDS